MVSGVVGGCAAGMCVWLSYASQYPGGLSPATFVKNTGEEYPMLGMVSNKMSIIVLFLIPFYSSRKHCSHLYWGFSKHPRIFVYQRTYDRGRSRSRMGKDQVYKTGSHIVLSRWQCQ